MQICNQGKWRVVGKFWTNAVSATWRSKLEPLECWIFLSTEFACFVAREISQVVEAMPGSVVPLAMFYYWTKSFKRCYPEEDILNFLYFFVLKPTSFLALLNLSLWEAPPKLTLPKFGGWAYLEKIYPSSNGHFLDIEESRCLPRWFRALF